MSVEDLYFLEVGIARQLDFFHSVKQGFGYILFVVCRAYEEHI
jgi:hypothetical protein